MTREDLEVFIFLNIVLIFISNLWVGLCICETTSKPYGLK